MAKTSQKPGKTKWAKDFSYNDVKCADSRCYPKLDCLRSESGSPCMLLQIFALLLQSFACYRLALPQKQNLESYITIT